MRDLQQKNSDFNDVGRIANLHYDIKDETRRALPNGRRYAIVVTRILLLQRIVSHGIAKKLPKSKEERVALLVVEDAISARPSSGID